MYDKNPDPVPIFALKEYNEFVEHMLDRKG